MHLNHPDIQAKIDRWVTETGSGPDESIEDAVAAYFEELNQTRAMLNARYDDLTAERSLSLAAKSSPTSAKRAWPVALTDTTPEAQAVQLNLHRAMTGEQKIVLAHQMSMFGRARSIGSGLRRKSRGSCSGSLSFPGRCRLA